jgi:hypothetical protein
MKIVIKVVVIQVEKTLFDLRDLLRDIAAVVFIALLL